MDTKILKKNYTYISFQYTMKQVKLLLSFFSDFYPIINANLIFLSRESRLLRSKIILFILHHLLQKIKTFSLMSFTNKRVLITSMPKRYCMLLFMILYYYWNRYSLLECDDARCIINYFLK